MTAVRKVLFVCGHNSARSRMAEAFLRHLGGVAFEVRSAGFEGMGVNPLVIEAMALTGVPLGPVGPQPSVFDLFKEGRYFNYVINVCDEDQGERCPLFPGVTIRITWGFPDPSTFTGSHDEKLARVIALRDSIRGRIEAWLLELQEELV